MWESNEGVCYNGGNFRGTIRDDQTLIGHAREVTTWFHASPQPYNLTWDWYRPLIEGCSEFGRKGARQPKQLEIGTMEANKIVCIQAGV